MIQQVNLYQGPTRKVAPPFGVGHIVKASLGLLVVLFVITAIELWRTDNLYNSFEDSRNRLHKIMAETESLKAKYSEVPVDRALQENLAHSKRMIARMRQILDYLTDSQSQRAQGFSTYFEGLARHTVSKVWFSGVTVIDGGRNLKLAGTTLLPDRVPKLLQLLKDEPAFRGKIFSSLVMEKQQNGHRQVDFLIDTKISEGSGHGGS